MSTRPRVSKKNIAHFASWTRAEVQHGDFKAVLVVQPYAAIGQDAYSGSVVFKHTFRLLYETSAFPQGVIFSYVYSDSNLDYFVNNNNTPGAQLHMIAVHASRTLAMVIAGCELPRK
jgi:hypothetical protein